MASAETDARLRFLAKASDILAVSSPSVSAYIRAATSDGSQLPRTETEYPYNDCRACARPLVVGWTCESVKIAEHRQTRKDRISASRMITKCVKCSACGTKNTIQHARRSKTARPKPVVPRKDPGLAILPKAEAKANRAPTPGTQPTQEVTPPLSKGQTPEPTQAKAPGRRKARGKNSSLQALLANKQPEAPKSSGFGLDFMDFMK